MRFSLRRTTALVGLSTIAVSGGFVAIAQQSQAAGRDGVCDETEVCYFYNSDQQGSVSDFTQSLDNYGSTQPDCYEFKGEGAGQGLCVKNNAASVWNRSTKPVTIYFNSGFAGEQQTVAPGERVNLVPALKNNNASHRFVEGDPAPAPAPPPADGSQVDGTISRAEVLDRANDWVKINVPYSMNDQHPDRNGRDYRTDCSGFVSMAFHTSTSYSTVSLPDVVTPISWDELKPGDIVGTLGGGTGGAGGHVVIFTGWADDAHTRFNTVEERGGGHGAIAYTRSVDETVGGVPFKPYRYNKIAD
ncbi:peptidase inhibitor family I36 protein [Metallococcus carri]|uniref:peptidase inhibitor family I36 protein n=1 Tax=Metallococcus carri TaxID=1656884 RepID=UPI001A9D04F3|nr:peptidase inhibitor family I36 protein [Metallococcus carri]